MTTGLRDPAELSRIGTTRPGPADAAALGRALHHRRLVLLRSLLERVAAEPQRVPAPVRRDFAAHWHLLTRAEARHPAAVRRVLALPGVGSRLAAVLAAPDGPALAERLPVFGPVAAAAATAAGHPFRSTLPAPTGALVLPGLGRFRCPDGRLRLTERTRPRTPMRRLPGIPSGRLDDADPYRVPPGLGGGTLAASQAGEVRRQSWLPLVGAAMELLTGTDRARATEIAALLRSLVPVEAAAAGRGAAGVPPAQSATLRAAPGAVLTTLPSSARETAEVLVHEIQHSKLAVLNDLVPLYRPGGTATCTVAWRSDPRPVQGALQGSYSHLALADLWHHLSRRPGIGPVRRRVAETRCEEYREQVAQAVPQLLDSGELTGAGVEFLRGAHRHLARLGRAATHRKPVTER